MRRLRAWHRRRLAAWLCLVALAASVVALPAMHAAVHLAERLAAEPAAPRPRVVVHRYGHCHGGSCHDESARHGGSGSRESHHHDGDRGGEHGRGSPEHLTALLAPASAPVLPPRVTPALIVERVAVLRPIAIALVCTYAARAPPPDRA